MSINVKTENVTDATVQVHIAFENAGRYRRYSKRKRSTRTYNRAQMRGPYVHQLTTGRNKADHRSSTKARLFKARRSEPEILPPRLLPSKSRSPA